MTDYKINLRKRIIYIIIGIVISYFGVIPLSLLFNPLRSGELPDPITAYLFYESFRTGIMILFLYFAFVHVKPSFVPSQKKFRKLVVFVILLIASLIILLPSGYVIPQLEYGACITKSGSYNEDGKFGGSSSQGMSNESDCIDSCIFSGKFNTREDKFCEFNGIFGKTNWMKSPDDFRTPVFEEIVK